MLCDKQGASSLSRGKKYSVLKPFILFLFHVNPLLSVEGNPMSRRERRVIGYSLSQSIHLSHSTVSIPSLPYQLPLSKGIKYQCHGLKLSVHFYVRVLFSSLLSLSSIRRILSLYGQQQLHHHGEWDYPLKDEDQWRRMRKKEGIPTSISMSLRQSIAIYAWKCKSSSMPFADNSFRP